MVSHPIQYQAPLFRALAAEPELDLSVFFLDDFSVRSYVDPGFGQAVEWDVPLLTGYRHTFLKPGAPGAVQSHARLLSALRHHEFDALFLHGYNHPWLLACLLAARAGGVKVVLRGESNLMSAPRGRLKQTLKALLMPALFRWVDAFACIGSHNRDYYRAYGVPEHKLFLMPYAVDNDFFQAQVAAAHPAREALRREMGLEPDQPVVLYASKLMKRKHPAVLLEAFARVLHRQGNGHRPCLLYVGSGEEEARLKARAAELPPGAVKFLGFQNQTALPRYYDLCDIFVLASEYEPWGLVVNEVMNAAKPLIVSDQVGSARDLVAPGENGWVVPARCPEALAHALEEALSAPQRLISFGQASLARITPWDIRQNVNNLCAALRPLCLETET